MAETPLDFIASLTGEAKAAALTVYNLMTPVWIEITADPATLPPMDDLMAVRIEEQGFEFLGVRTLIAGENEWCWSMPLSTNWDWINQKIAYDDAEHQDWIVTHWRPIA
jgi:hypothetical protein